MNTTSALIAFRNTGRRISWTLMFKAIVGLSLLFLSLAGVFLPMIGIAATFATESAAAIAGGVLGAILAVRA